jgi:nucleotide-binding universal stress UspA family protein
MKDYLTILPDMATSRLFAVSAPMVERRRPLQIKTLLVPLDLSPASLRTLQFSISLAERFGATIHVLHVRPMLDSMALEHAGDLTLNEADAIAFLQDRLAETQEKHDIKFSPDNCHVLSGRPFQEICRMARQIESDLIIMPSRGRNTLRRALLGSTSERVLRCAPCPVLITRRKKLPPTMAKLRGKTPFQLCKILAPVDFSECSHAGTDYAAFLAQAVSAKLRFLHVVFPYSEFIDLQGMNARMEPLVAEEHAHARKEMKTWTEAKSLGKIPRESEIRDGSPIEVICSEAALPDVDLVVIATHGRTGFRHALIGSVAEAVARYADCPVVVVPGKGRC